MCYVVKIHGMEAEIESARTTEKNLQKIEECKVSNKY